MEKCNRCHLKNPVANRGSQSSKILIITDYPSKSDVSLGEILAGQEGKLLEILFNPFKYYITSLLKCMPDTDLPDAEILRCTYHLNKIVYRNNFKYIFLMGKMTEKYLKKELPGSIIILPMEFLVLQGGQKSHWYQHTLRTIKEGLK